LRQRATLISARLPVARITSPPFWEDNGVVGSNASAVLISLVVILLLAFVMRWVFKPARPRPSERPVNASDAADLGLLTVVATGVNRHDAMSRRATLGEAGIRSSMSKRRDGTHDILVFDADADAARLLLGR
jgi:hypothetical protein